MIILEKLEWSNWFSYGADNVINFTDSTLTQILGKNGAGKSSIPLILEETLYGKNSKGIVKSDIPNWNLDKPKLSSVLHMIIDGIKYTIKLERKTGIKLSLYKDNEDISFHTSKETYKAIESIIGMDHKTFSQLIYQSSTSSLQFLTATDATRKAFLIKLFGLNKYVSIYEDYKLISKDISSEVSALKGSLNTTQLWLNKYNNMALVEKDLIAVPEDPEEDRELLATKLYELNNIKAINTKINSNNTYKKMLSELKPTTAVSDSEAANVKKEEELNEKIASTRAEITAKNNTITKLRLLTDAECPTCLQQVDLDRKAEILKGAEEAKSIHAAQLFDLTAELNEITEIKRRIAKELEDKREFETLWSKIDQDLASEVLDPSELSEEILALRTKISSKLSEIKRAEEYNKEAVVHNNKIEGIREQIADYTKELEGLTAKLERKEKLFSYIDILKKAFSTTGLLSYKLEFLVKDLEATINTYLAALSGGKFLIEFGLSGDKLVVNIVNDGKTVKISTLSTGQLARVNTATLLAIRKLMSNISKSRINVLFLDETMAVLDAEGRDILVEMLLNENNLNTFLVSHEYSHPLLAKLEVTTDGKISRLEDG